MNYRESYHVKLQLNATFVNAFSFMLLHIISAVLYILMRLFLKSSIAIMV